MILRLQPVLFFLFLPSFLAFPLPSFIPLLLLSLSLLPFSFPFPPKFFLFLRLPCIPYLSFYLLSFLKDINLTSLYLLICNGTPLQYSCLENPVDGGAWWAAVPGVAASRTWLSGFAFTFHFHSLEKEMATHSSILAWRILGTEEPVGCCLRGRTESDTTEVT